MFSFEAPPFLKIFFLFSLPSCLFEYVQCFYSSLRLPRVCRTSQTPMMNTVLKMLFLLSCWMSTGVLAEEAPVMHYQLKNSSVCLHVRKGPPYNNKEWEFDDKIIVVGDEVNSNYTEKVVYYPENLTLCINDLTESDSGSYKVSFKSNFRPVSLTHQVIVEDLVPRPVMMTPEKISNLSLTLCNFTVNCSIQDDFLESVCDENLCRTSQKSFTKFNITILINNTTVVCRGNNHVSANNVSERTERICFRKSVDERKDEPKPGPDVVMIIIIVCASLLVCAAIAVIKLIITITCRRQAATSAALLIQSGPLETQQHSEPRGSTSSSGSEVEPSYENVEISQPSESSIPRGEQGSRDTQGVDTIYSYPKKTGATAAKQDSSEDPAGTRKEQKPPESAAPDKEQSPTHIDTVYTVLQMPKNLKSERHREDL